MDGVLARIAAGMDVHHLEEMAVQMDRMGHHRVVDENDARAFVAFEADRLDAFAEFFAIERPHEALHVAGEMNLDRALRRARVRIGGERHQVAVGQHRSEEHTSELQSLMRISYAVFCLNTKKKKTKQYNTDKIK